MANSADPDQLASKNWSGSTLFEMQGIYGFSRIRVKSLDSQVKKICVCVCVSVGGGGGVSTVCKYFNHFQGIFKSYSLTYLKLKLESSNI